MNRKLLSILTIALSLESTLFTSSYQKKSVSLIVKYANSPIKLDNEIITKEASTMGQSPLSTHGVSTSPKNPYDNPTEISEKKDLKKQREELATTKKQQKAFRTSPLWGTPQRVINRSLPPGSTYPFNTKSVDELLAVIMSMPEEL